MFFARCLGVVLSTAAFLTLALAAAAAPGDAGRRVALVIGNGAYAYSPGLANPANDARAMAALLEGMGFEVVNTGPDGPGLVDLDLAGMNRALALFGRQARGSEIAAVFYAGHGLEVGGVNYLLPVDARLQDELDLPLEAVDLDTMMRFASVASTRIVLLDACRDNPLAARMTVSQGTRGIGRGLAQIDQVETGSLLGYATSPGAVASDGAGEHSPYTAALLTHLGARGVSLTDAMTRVNAAVQDATGGAQIPWMNSSLREVIQLAGPAPAAEPAAPQLFAALGGDGQDRAAAGAQPAPSPVDTDLLDWRLATQMNTAAAFRAYIATHCPGGHGCALAEASVASMAAAEVSGAAAVTTAERKAAALHPTLFDMAALTQPQDRAPPGGAAPPQLAPQQFAVPAPPQVQASPEAAALAYQEGLNRSDRLDVQRRLDLVGFDPRGVDGVFGANTYAAISAWQGARGYAATGVLGAQQHAHLLSESQPAFDAWRARAARQARQTPQKTYQRAVAPSATTEEASNPRGGTLIERFLGDVGDLIKPTPTR
ncbi:caspase family protein [Rubrimonas cliftonensis]|nr:caspase family protein [Rubrimonas cliftonensis]